MPNLTQPPIPKPFVTIFNKFNISIKHFENSESFEKDLLVFIKRNHVLHLSMCKDNLPRSTPLEYRFFDFKFYILSAGGGKFDFLKANTDIAFSIAEPYNSDIDYWSYKGLQAWGKAEVISKKNNPAEFDLAFNKMNVMKVLNQMGITELLPEMNYKIIIISPEKIKYNNPREGIFRVTWEQ